MAEKKQKEYYLRAFLIVFGAAMIALIPIMAVNGGRFFYYGDYNKQQIMFYTHLHDLVRGGDLAAWDHMVDLGSDTVSSFSFYLLGSPFFWLTIPLPSSLIVSVMPVLIAVKSGIAAVGAYALTRRFCQSRSASLIAAVLFGLSSYNSANLLFNHFHDAVLMIPFMLLALEMLVKDGRRGFFALTVALAACINYYFFFGQVIFLVLYYVVAVITGHFTFSPKKLLQIFFEGVLGGMLAGVILLPSAMAVVNNPRIDDMLSGSDLFVYDYKSIYLYIIKNMFMLPDITLLKNFGVDRANELQNNYHSFYIHFFSFCGVFAYYRGVKGKDLFKVLLAVCGVIMMVPFLNQSFSFMNSKFYGRWFFMPVLIACIMTALAVERWQKDETDIKKGFIPTAAVTGVVTAASLAVIMLAKYGVINVGFENYTYAYVQIVFTLTALAFLWMTLYKPADPNKDAITKALINRSVAFAAAGMCLVVWCSYLFRGESESYKMNYVYDYAESGDRIEDDSFYRTSCESNLMNMPVIWGYKTVRYFNSTVESSIADFYNAFEFERTVKSDYEPTEYAIMELLSVKYYIDGGYYDMDGNLKEPSEYLTGTADTYKIMYQKNDMNFYENTEFLPMGFAFDSYSTNAELWGQPSVLKGLAYLEALVLSDEQIEKYGDILTHYDTEDIKTAAKRYHEICEERRSMACSEFKEGKSRFDAKITLEKPSLVFFSIPYSEGWSAEVNGREAEIENVDNGMMAVKCEAGESSITFTYRNKYLEAGALITLGGAVIFAVYIAAGIMLRKKSVKQEKANE
ncbi:MAG: YfhO family protein [Ruminococcus sp.]|nr:YfhO family protein [Ruminococcus sp.]